MSVSTSRCLILYTLAALVVSSCFGTALASTNCDDTILDDKPELRFETTPADVTANRGDKATLECKVFARPQATIFWLKNGEQYMGWPENDLETLNPGQHVLETAVVVSTIEIDKVTEQSVGVYSCIAVTACHEKIRADAEITLKAQQTGEPDKKRSTGRRVRHPQIYMWTADMIEYDNRNAQLTCRATFDHMTGSIHWLEIIKEASETDENEIVELITKDNDAYEILPNGDLIVKADAWSPDDGKAFKQLRCVAANVVGATDSKDIMIFATKEE